MDVLHSCLYAIRKKKMNADDTKYHMDILLNGALYICSHACRMANLLKNIPKRQNILSPLTIRDQRASQLVPACYDGHAQLPSKSRASMTTAPPPGSRPHD